MIIELPKEFSINEESERKVAFIEDGILKMTRNISFRKVMIEITYQLEGRKECKYCHTKVTEDEITIDHIFPSDFGGPTIPDNLMPACKKCNNEKENMTYEQYMAFLQAKGIGMEKQYLKSLRRYQESLRRKGIYQIPEEWIVQKNMTDIITSINLDDNYKCKRYKTFENYYLKYGKIQKPIVIDRRSFLLDGFLQLMLAKNYNINSIPVIVLENVEVII